MTSARAYRVFVIEDDGIVIFALKHLLATTRDFVLVGDSTGVADINRLRAATPDIVILDIMLPDPYPVDVTLREKFPHGFEIIVRIRDELPHIKVVVFSGDPRYFSGAAARGAHGIIEKDVEPAEIIPKLLQVMRGETVMPQGTTATPRYPEEERNVRTLTRREAEVGREMALGRSTDRIAETLDITEATVQEHKKSIYLKLDVHDGANAVRALILGGILKK